MNTMIKVSTLALMTALTLTGCNSVKGMVGKDKKEVIATAEKGEADYYKDAERALEKGRYREAMLALNNIRTFYPTGQYAQQALLDLIYAQYNAKDYEAVIASTAEFMRLYPTSPYYDYALYVQGVTNMQGSPRASRIFKLDQSDRDISYLRLAFADFQTLVTRMPNSAYAPDAAQRMTALYNDFAHHELNVAHWYIKRDAYVAAANRAKWIFQYFPQSASTPEAIAILAYSNDKLGLKDTADQYKTLLQINYPNQLNADGSVRINDGSTRSFGKKMLGAVSLGKFGRAKDTPTYQGSYDGATRTQVIRNASGLVLPSVEDTPITEAKPERTRRIGLGLPSGEAEAGLTNQAP